MKKVSVVIAGLGGRGRDIYGRYILNHSDTIEVKGIADLQDVKRTQARKDFNLPIECCFATAEELFSKEKLADCALICTQDKEHVKHAKMAIQKGYHLLLEKPISDKEEECRELLEIARKHNRQVVVCHVLRYTPFYRTIKKAIEDKMIGEVVTIQAIENVGYWHQAHSFVRGSWRNREESSPMILAKCCHDIDILLWLAQKKCRKVSSFGSNYLFKKEKAPKGAALRCTDNCNARENCPYDALDFYVENPITGVKSGKVDWPINIVASVPTEETVTEALKTGPYGRCVYHCDNNVVDHQVVNMLCEEGVTINFTMTAFSDRCYRYLKVMGTKGSIEADMDKNEICISIFGKDKKTVPVNIETSIEGHGGGDELMMDEFIEMIQGNLKGEMGTCLENSIESHLVALAAEESRLKEGTIVCIS